jgi:flagellar motor switch/type III secretory pathway protein FliN
LEAAVKPVQDTQNETLPEVAKDIAGLFGWLRCDLSLELPVGKFTVGDLLRLGKGSVVETNCLATSEIPLRVNGLLVAWTEFEVIGTRLAVRVTELE